VLLRAPSGVIGWLDGAPRAGIEALVRELDTAQAVAERKLQARATDDVAR